MDLQKELDESGYTAKLEILNAAKGMRDMVVRDIDTLPNKAMIPQLRRDLAEAEAWIAREEPILAEIYAEAVAYVDKYNDADFAVLQLQELAELVAENLDKTDLKAGAKARAIMRGERPD